MEGHERKGKRTLRERTIAFWERHRIPLIIIAIGIGLLILLLTFTKAYLIVRLLLGNDVLLELTTGNATVVAAQGATIAMPLTVTVTTNPFCAAVCGAILRDIGDGDAVHTESFTVRTGDPHKTEWDVQLPERGTGQALYRWEVRCAARQTLMCHTSGIPVTREAITTISYAPTQEEIDRLSAERTRLLAADTAIAQAYARIAAIGDDLRAINSTIIVDSELAQASDAASAISDAQTAFAGASAAWDAEDSSALSDIATIAQAALADTIPIVDALRVRTDDLIAHHAQSAARLEAARLALAPIAQDSGSNASVRAAANATLAQYETVRGVIAQSRVTPENRTAALDALDAAVGNLTALEEEDRVADAIWRETRLTLVRDALCARNLTCIAHPGIIWVANLTVDRRADSCERARNASADLLALNATLTIQAGVDILNTTLTAQASSVADDGMRDARIAALAMLTGPPTPHAARIAALLTPVPPPTGAVDAPGIAPLVGLELISRIPGACPNATLIAPLPAGIAPIVPSPVVTANATIALPDPVPRCCALGSCAACCDGTACRATIPAPIVLLHGHAFNSDTSAAYSLDAFDRVQARLEEDGYVSMGTLDMSATGIPDASWTRANAPISVKASYYYDVYASPDNAALVQTKTENVDTYAIRLKDIIDEVRRRTGQERVTIVAHSMGGLVTRRYLQIFGDSAIERVVMVGTPNHGIAGNIADYCTWLGEDLECRDMKEGSLFLNKLERAGTPSIPVTVIIGLGCAMEGEDGDGVVTGESAALPWATNLYLNGTCGGLDTLHTAMLGVDKYPQTYEYLLAAVRD